MDPLKSDALLASPRWLIGAIFGVFILAAVALYGTICLLFWQGQWQVVFHPSRSVPMTPASIGLKYDDIRFDASETGALQLSGWWIPAQAGGRYSSNTLLFLRDGSGSLSTSLAQVGKLHALGINLFAFDYRGFGASAALHPSEKSTHEDAEAAWRYLTETRHLTPQSIVLYGIRLGAAVAVETALHHPESPAVVVEELQAPTLQLLSGNPRLRWLPIRLLFHDRFDPSQALTHLSTPKLFLNPSRPQAPPTKLRDTNSPLYYAAAEPPKISVLLAPTPTLSDNPTYLETLSRFLDEYLPRAAPEKP